MDNDGYICAAPELSIAFEAIDQRFERGGPGRAQLSFRT